MAAAPEALLDCRLDRRTGCREAFHYVSTNIRHLAGGDGAPSNQSSPLQEIIIRRKKALIPLDAMERDAPGF